MVFDGMCIIIIGAYWEENGGCQGYNSTFAMATFTCSKNSIKIML
jgi:hypothetical protein